MKPAKIFKSAFLKWLFAGKAFSWRAGEPKLPKRAKSKVRFFNSVGRRERLQQLFQQSFLGVATFVLVCVLVSETASAEDWMFRRSYFSHMPPPGVRVDYPLPKSRSAYRRAYRGGGWGFSVKSSYRYNRIYLRSGNSADVTIQREQRFQFLPWGW